MSGIIVKGAMGLRPGQVLQRLGSSQVAEVDWIGIEKSGGYKVIKDRYGKTGHADEPPDYAGTPEVVSIR